MAELISIARPYAKAAFEYAIEENTLAAWSEQLTLLAQAAKDPSIVVLLDSPKVTSDELAEVFIEVCAKTLSQSGKNFVTTLADNKRLDLIEVIAFEFEHFKALHEKRVDAIIESAYALKDAQIDELTNALSKKLGRTVTATTTINKDLIGGAVIRTNDQVIDGSVRGKLDKLALALTA